MNAMTYSVALACAGLFVGCAATSSTPAGIIARQTLNQASEEQATSAVPAELYKTHAGNATTGNAATAKASTQSQKPRAAIAKNSEPALAASRPSAADTAETIAKEHIATIEAKRRTADLQADLAILATVRDEARGAVITLSGRVLFASDQSTILKRALDQLSRVADALLEMKERRLTIDAYADATDSTNRKQELSQERANAVRSYLISLGYPGDLIQARGFGEKSPIAGNASAEGRADSRRVEIAISRVAR